MRGVARRARRDFVDAAEEHIDSFEAFFASSSDCVVKFSFVRCGTDSSAYRSTSGS